MLKSMGERTPPCGTPDLNCRFVDVWFLNVVYAMRPLMSFSTVFAITDRRDIGLYDVPMLMSLLGLGIGMMLTNFQT